MTDSPIEAYVRTVVGLVSPLPPVRMTLTEAVGCVLAEDIVARAAVPRFDVSAMDGFALRSGDAGAHSRFRVIADIPAGSAQDPKLASGECVQIMTGAAVPSDADCVVPIERVSFEGADIDVDREDVRPGAHIRPAGQDVNAGDVLAQAGTRISAGVVSAAAACGVGSAAVRPRPRVAVMATGNELRQPDEQHEPLARGEIYESNSAFVAGVLADCDVTIAAPAPDDAEALRARLDELTADHDLVVMTGGAGGGKYDIPGQVVASCSQHGSARLPLQPGKPQAWAVWGDTPVLVLPGNPLAAAVSALLFAHPMTCALSGAEPVQPLTAICGDEFTGRVNRTQFIPVVAEFADGTIQVRRAHARGLGSHLVSTLVQANALAVLPNGVDVKRAGEWLEVYPFGGHDPFQMRLAHTPTPKSGAM